jgi:BASS family bile acid:Na+ symporter
MHKMKLISKIPFSVWIVLAVIVTLIKPEPFVSFGGFQFKALIIPLLQVIMFGMGSTMGVEDFQEVIKSPKSVFLGVFFHFLIMPLVGFTLTKLFSFPDEIAAGIILVGSMPCGLASNVMSYLAKANLALSLTLTSISTLLAPILTPLLIKVLANQLIEINFWEMVWEICKLILIPIFFGLVYKKLIGDRWNWLQKHLSTLSMWSIAFIIIIITANGRNSLLSVGPLLVLACLIHNLCGFFFGYYGARLTGLPERDARTIAIEVGLQNAGLASGLAMALNKVATLGLPAAIFGPVMNITGSTLANYWKRK